MTERGQSSVSALPGPWAFVQQKLTVAWARGRILSWLLLEESDKGVGEWQLVFQGVGQGRYVTPVQSVRGKAGGMGLPHQIPTGVETLTIGNVIGKTQHVKYT